MTTYTTLSVDSVQIGSDAIAITGSTDLPDGTVVNVDFSLANAPGDQPFRGVSANATVSDGSFHIDLPAPKHPDFAGGAYEIGVICTPKTQSDEILSLIGEDGENLGGNNSSETLFGFRILEQTHPYDGPDRLEIPDFVVQSAELFEKGTPEQGVVQILHAWHRKDWEEMARYAAVSWLKSEKNPPQLLATWFDFKELLGAEILGTNRSDELVVDIRMRIRYAVGPRIETCNITARVLHEDVTGRPSHLPRARWGTDLTSMLHEDEIDPVA